MRPVLIFLTLRVNKSFCQITPHFPSFLRPFIRPDFLSLFYHHGRCSLSFPSRPRRPRSLSSNSDVCNLSSSSALLPLPFAHNAVKPWNTNRSAFLERKRGTEKLARTKVGQTLINSRPSAWHHPWLTDWSCWNSTRWFVKCRFRNVCQINKRSVFDSSVNRSGRGRV